MKFRSFAHGWTPAERSGAEGLRGWRGKVSLVAHERAVADQREATPFIARLHNHQMKHASGDRANRLLGTNRSLQTTLPVASVLAQRHAQSPRVAGEIDHAVIHQDDGVESEPVPQLRQHPARSAKARHSHRHSETGAFMTRSAMRPFRARNRAVL